MHVGRGMKVEEVADGTLWYGNNGTRDDVVNNLYLLPELTKNAESLLEDLENLSNKTRTLL